MFVDLNLFRYLIYNDLDGNFLKNSYKTPSGDLPPGKHNKFNLFLYLLSIV